MNPDSFKKGQAFETYVESELFSQEDYILVHRTNSFEQNKSRYAEETLKPDFKFRCKTSQSEFYIEAKYRSHFNKQDKLEVISYPQIERFKSLKREENIPIFLAIGYEGYPSEPNYVSLIPLEELLYLELYPSFLKKFHINKEGIKSCELNLWNEPKINYKIKEEPKHSEPIEEATKPLKVKSSNLIKTYKVGITALTGIVILICLIAMLFFGKENYEKSLRERTRAYYQTIEMGELEKLADFINPQVDKWYNKRGLTIEEIISQAASYIKYYPNTETLILWDSFEVTPINENYLVSYKLIYKIFNGSNDKDKIYHLKIKAIWDKDFKLKSISEERL